MKAIIATILELIELVKECQDLIDFLLKEVNSEKITAPLERSRFKIQDIEYRALAWNRRLPTVVCLCGSTRFSEAFQEANLKETLAGRIVLTIGCDMKSDNELFEDLSETELQGLKVRLDDLHLRKIDIADEVLILNVNGYVGQSTRRELEYARVGGKKIRWLEPDKAI